MKSYNGLIISMLFLNLGVPEIGWARLEIYLVVFNPHSHKYFQ